MININVLNLVLCIVILVLGLLAYKKSGNDIPLYIALAFGLFGFSHFAKIAGIIQPYDAFFVIDRTIAYLLVIFVLYKAVAKK